MKHSLHLCLGLILVIIWALLPIQIVAQKSPRPQIFAHNDYAQPEPFFHAYAQQVAYIEADVFVRDGDLWVAHDEKDLQPERTLQKLYLQPLIQKVQKYGGYPYRHKDLTLTLMIDFKTPWETTLPVLVDLLRQRFPTLLQAQNLTFCISGAMPPPERWPEIPAFIYFDGRPQQTYTTPQLQRILLVSHDYNRYSSWRGEGICSVEDKRKLQAVVQKAADWQKLCRFWAIPDHPAGWQLMMEMGVQVLNTDRVKVLKKYLRNYQ